MSALRRLYRIVALLAILHLGVLVCGVGFLWMRGTLWRDQSLVGRREGIVGKPSAPRTRTLRRTIAPWTSRTIMNGTVPAPHMAPHCGDPGGAGPSPPSSPSGVTKTPSTTFEPFESVATNTI